MPGRQGLRLLRTKIQGFQECDERGFLSLNQRGVSSHFNEPGGAVAVLDGPENASGTAAGGILPGHVVELGGLAAGLDVFRGVLQCIIGRGLQSDLAAPAIDVGEIAAGHAGERNDTDVRSLAIIACDLERGNAHFAGRNRGPAGRSRPRDGLGVLDIGGHDARGHRGGRIISHGNVRMAGREAAGIGRRGGGSLVLIRGDLIDLDFLPAAAGGQKQSCSKQERGQKIQTVPNGIVFHNLTLIFRSREVQGLFCGAFGFSIAERPASVRLVDGCGGKPAEQKTAMNAELINFAERLARGISQQETVFDRLALDLFGLQFKYNPAYRRFSEVRGVTPDIVRHWTEVPFVPAAGFKELELSCISPDERTAVFHSSGTTEQKPSRHFHCPESLAVYKTSLWTAFEENVLGALHEPPSERGCVEDQPQRVATFGAAAAGAPLPRTQPRSVCQPVHGPNACEHNRKGAPPGRADLSVGQGAQQRVPATDYDLVVLAPHPRSMPHSSLVHMFETVRRKLAAPETVFVGELDVHGAWVIDFDAALAALRVTGRSKLILGTAFSFVHLLDFLAEKQLRLELPNGSRVMETGGYKNRSRTMPKTELHSLITEFLGIRREQIICEYGMSELSSQAYDSGNAGRHFHFPPWARTQIISPETGREVGDGETGLIRIFDLANVFSVAAVQTEDLAVRRGDGFELIGRAALAEPRGCSLMTA